MNLSEITLPDMSGGLNTREPQYEIADNQSPDMLNLWFRDRALVKRPGQQITVEGLAGGVHKISDEFNGFRVIHAGNKLYRWDEAGTKNYKGVFSPSAGYPESEDGDYYVASEPGTAPDGTYYSVGERAVYSSTYAQTEKITVSGTVTVAGKVKVTITGASFDRGVVDVGADIGDGDTAAQIAKKIRTELNKNDAAAELYEAIGEDGDVILRQKIPAPFDDTLSINISNNTCAGLTEATSSGNTMWHKAVEEIPAAKEGTELWNEAGVFVLFGDVLYHIDGSEIWEIKEDAGGVLRYTSVFPYEPVVMINCAADLSQSTDHEAYNLLGGGFRVKYNGNAGGNVCYYVATITPGTFTVTDVPGSTTPMDLTTAADGVTDWKVKKQGNKDWISTTPTIHADTDTIELSNHGFSVMDMVQFDPGTGTLPSGLKAWNSDAVTVYKLPVTDIDETAVIVEINATPVGGENYTVDRTVENNATVTFTIAPATGTDNVLITAYKTIPGYKKRITGCKSAVAFGGESGGVAGGTRVFVGANPEYPQNYWHSDIGLHVGAGMGYFPDTGEELLDQTGGATTAMAKMGSELVIFKDTSIFAVRYSYDGKDVYFPVRECNGFVGCDIPGSVQLIDNRLVFANTRSGVNMLISTNNELENIVKPLSANINGLLLNETGLKEACSCDYDRHYWLCTNGSVYLWDYDKTPYYNYSDYDQAQKRLAWYRWNGVKADIFSIGRSLYYGFEDGIAAFSDTMNDFGHGYEAYYTSKAFDLGKPEELKTFMYVYPSFSWDGNISVRISVGSDKTLEYMTKDLEICSFNWTNFNWEHFTWNITRYAKTLAMRLAMKKVSYIQIKISGLQENRGVGLSGLRITYFVNKKIKE